MSRKDPDKRWQSAREIKHALEWLLVEPAAVDAAAAQRAHKRAWMWPALSAILLVLLAVTGWMLWRKAAAPAHATRFEVTLPPNVPSSGWISVSPDGRKLVFPGTQTAVPGTGPESGLWIHDLDTVGWRELPGTEGAIGPFWSPDSHFLAFGVGHDLKKIDVAGGPPQTLCSVPEPAADGAWGRDGIIVFGVIPRPGAPIRRVSQAGGIPADVTVLESARGEQSHALPTWLPDGKHFLYLRVGASEVAGIYAASLDAKPSEQPPKRILATRFGATYLDGKLFFMRDGTLMEQVFDAGKLELHGEPVPVAEHVGTFGSTGIFSISPAGVLAYRAAPGDEVPSQPAWFDRKGKMIGTPGAFVPDLGLTLSPDGTRAVGRDATQGSQGDIWLLDFTRGGVRTRLTFSRNLGTFPVWSPDGNHIAFSGGSNPDTIYEKAASGASEEKLLLKSPGIKVPTSWSRDGRFLLYFTVGVPKTADDLWVLPLEGQQAGKPALLLGTEFVETLGSFSPDGRWVAYLSTETGRYEIYVRPFVADGPSLGDGKWQLSTEGTATAKPPRWRSDGKEIIFAAPNGTIMAVDLNVGNSALAPGIPHPLFTPVPNRGWDATADGQRFLVQFQPGQRNTQAPISVVLNWEADLKR